jgi:hypothetical protein
VFPFQWSWSDPTLVFAIVCGVFPALKARDPAVMLQYVTDPVCIAIFSLTMGVYCNAKYTPGKQACLQPWEHQAAMWYLLNGAVFHLLLDFGVGNLKALPVMQQNYQMMDLRYGCLPQHPCGTENGITKSMEPMVWLLTWIEATIDAPLCFVIFTAYLKGWACRKPLEIALATSHILGTLLFMGTELYDGLHQVPPAPNNVGGPNGLLENAVGLDYTDSKFEAQFSFFWFAFIACNSIWYYVPAKLGWIAYEDIVASLAHNRM